MNKNLEINSTSTVADLIKYFKEQKTVQATFSKETNHDEVNIFTHTLKRYENYKAMCPDVQRKTGDTLISTLTPVLTAFKNPILRAYECEFPPNKIIQALQIALEVPIDYSSYMPVVKNNIIDHKGKRFSKLSPERDLEAETEKDYSMYYYEQGKKSGKLSAEKNLKTVPAEDEVVDLSSKNTSYAEYISGNSKTSYGQRFKELRLEWNLSVEEFALVLGTINVETIVEVEECESIQITRHSEEHERDIALTFGVPLAWLRRGIKKNS